MSEYWKSTERYWCKHCKLFVKDTKIERQNHDATPRHQGNLKRFVRDLHKSNDKEEREKQRAKDEVARLNGMVSGGSGFSKASSSSTFNSAPGGSSSLKSQPQGSRKEQLQQLVDLGVALPDEFRKELSMTGEWKTVSERIIKPEDTDTKPEAIGYGVRKRVNPEDEEEEEEKETKRRRWESTHKTHKLAEDDDLDALLSSGIMKKEDKVKTELKDDGSTGISSADPAVLPKSEDKADDNIPNLKKEPSDGELRLSPVADNAGMKQEDEVPTSGVIFKKRAKKNLRQKG